MSKSLIQLSKLLKEVKIHILTINQACLLLTLTFHSMPKNTDIQTHCIEVPSAVEIVLQNVVGKKEISIMKKKNF